MMNAKRLLGGTSLVSIVASATLVVACGSSSSSGSPSPGNDAGATDSSAQVDGSGGDAGATPTTTIAQARSNNVTTPITVVAIVTAVRGDDPMDTKEWYIEDAAGGPNSGISVYCNKTAKSNACPASITAPAVGDKVQLTGTISPYKGKIEIQPTAQTTLSSMQPLPAAVAVQPSDLSASGMSQYRGVLVKLATKLTVDDVTPAKLYNTKCAEAGAPPADGGSDAGAPGMPLCSGCTPPSYAGFQANAGTGAEVFVENYFFTSDHLQNSPECLSQMGMKPVNVGMTFSSMTGIVDVDPTAGVQFLAPTADSDYVSP